MSTVSDAPARRKLAAERMGPQRHMTLPPMLGERVNTAARRLGVSRTLLLREAVRLGLKAAVGHLRRDQRHPKQEEASG